MSTHLNTRIKSPGPKKILALDGGGIRGMITVEILAKMEALLQKELKRDNQFVLSDYFDFVAGTSTGAIIAACVSIGMRVDQIREFYINSGKEMFDKAKLLKRFYYQYKDEKLADKLKSTLGDDTQLGSDKLKTLLMLVMRNATTDSPWPISNVPGAKYNDLARSDCNLKIPLWKLIRASAAAPTYFPPEVVPVEDKEFLFVDGGITTYNNPSFQTFLMATMDAYKLRWQAGEKNILLISIGTGTCPDANKNLEPDDMNLIYNAKSLPSALMYAALNEQDMLCRVFGRCLEGDAIDREVGDLKNEQGPSSSKLFTYARYNTELTEEGLEKLGINNIKPESVQKLDSVDAIPDLQKIGIAVANKVKLEHFNGFLH
jgi:uncharacterized protein